jgi:putative hydrolase of the HAD superfamily
MPGHPADPGAPPPLIRGVLFDVGGPLNTEVAHERLTDEHIRGAFAAEGHPVDGAAYERACRWAVECFAPDAYRAIVWELAGRDAALAERVHRRFRERRAERLPFELREGIAGVLERLHGRGLQLGLAANQPVSTVAVLDELGIGRYFSHRQVSEHHGYRKPDVRLFLRACEDLGVEPRACVMVGDRIDNDVVPARLLGMRTVLFRTGRHIQQQPRTWDELPDAEVRTVADLEAAIVHLVTRAGGR